MVALAPKAQVPAPDSSQEESPSAGPGKRYSLLWSQLRARVFEEDVTLCRRCGGSLKISAAILDRAAIARILAAMDFPSEAPKFHPPSRGPASGDDPQPDLWFGDESYVSAGE